MSVLRIGFNLHKTLLSIIDLVMRFQEWFSAEREKSFLVCRTRKDPTAGIAKNPGYKRSPSNERFLKST